MKKKTLVFVLVLLLGLFAFVGSASAKTVYQKVVSSPSPTPVASVDSFDLFWPLSPGKTRSDSLYGLKVLKEKVRGLLIFGKPQKADYKVFLATKRSLEAEKLLSDGNQDLAKATLDEVNADLGEGYNLWKSITDNESKSGVVKDQISVELAKLEKFYAYLSSKNDGDVKSKIDQALEKVRNFKSTL